MINIGLKFIKNQNLFIIEIDFLSPWLYLTILSKTKQKQKTNQKYV